MAIDLTARVSGLDGVNKALTDTRKIIRESAYFAAINSGEKARDAVQAEMKAVFDRPTPFVLRSLRLTNKNGNAVGKTIKVRSLTGGSDKRVRQNEFSVLLGFIDSFQSITGDDPVTNALLPSVEGGRRRAKPSEIRLRRNRVLAGDEFLVPSRTAPRDRYGNVPPAEYVRMLSDLRTFNDGGFTANSKYKTGRGHYLIIETAGFKGIFKSRSGYSQRAVSNAQLIWIIVKGAPKYRKRLRFYEIAGSTYDKHYKAEFDKVLARQLKRAA